MNARQEPASLSEQAAFLAERHNRVLLNALQAAASVSYQGTQARIAVLIYQLSGGSIDTDVVLDGREGMVAGALIKHEPASWDAPESQRHARVLLHALQTAHRVKFDGAYRFIHTLRFAMVDEDVETTVYLTGSGEPVDSELVQVVAEPAFLQHPAVAGPHSPRGAI